MAPSSKVILDYNDIFVDHDVSKYSTRPILTKYEKTAVMSMRVEQLTRGAQPCVDAAGMRAMRDIAEAELVQKVLPFIVVRTLPNDSKEYWRLSELRILAD